MSSFVSAGSLDAKHAELEQERQRVLAEAKAQFEREQAQEEATRKRKERTGEDTWIAPSIERRISSGENLDGNKRRKKAKEGKRKKEKKDKKDKKEKKEKKHKKKHKKQKGDGDGSSSSSDEDEDIGAGGWVEKPMEKSEREKHSSWMFGGAEEDPFAMLMGAPKSEGKTIPSSAGRDGAGSRRTSSTSTPTLIKPGQGGGSGWRSGPPSRANSSSSFLGSKYSTTSSATSTPVPKYGLQTADQMRSALTGKVHEDINLEQSDAAGPADVSTPSSSIAPLAPGEQLLLRESRSGVVMPARGVAVERERDAVTGKIKRRKEKLDTHSEAGGKGDRLRYFADDDQNSDLKKMVEQERLGLDDDPDQVFRKYSSKFMAKTDDDDYTMDDMFVDRIGKQQAAGKQENRDRDRAIAGHIRMQKQLDSCRYCFDNEAIEKHLIVSLGQKMYMSLPARGSLVEGHALLIPVRHVTACTEMDEDVYEEMQVFQENLVKMWAAQGKDVVFMETVYSMKYKKHTMIHCIPLEQENGELAPMFFKKAIQDCQTWNSQNKTLVDTRKKGLRKSIPKGFPYFSVSFGMDGGFAHVIEDESVFPKHFGAEILGNIVDVPPRTWLNPARERFEDQKRKVVKFAKQWEEYDWTSMLDEPTE